MIERMRQWLGRRTEEPTVPPTDPETLQRRLQMHATPRQDNGGLKMRDKVDAQMKAEQEVSEGARRCLFLLTNNLDRVERPDQYITLIDNIFDKEKASPAVVRRVCEYVKANLLEYYRMNAGAKTAIRGERGDSRDIRVLPTALTTPRFLDTVGSIANSMTAHGEEYIRLKHGGASQHRVDAERATGS